MMIREAEPSDKRDVLSFCKKTFLWGDYIEYVWDYWLREGNLFVAIDKKPIGICHSFISNNQIWIEGIRIHPDFRRKKIASKLIQHSEFLARKQNLSISFMLIDTKNWPSFSLAEHLGYSVFETWHYYSLEKKFNSNFDVRFGNCIPKNVNRYVRSWRWLPLDDYVIFSMLKNNQIVYSDKERLSFALLKESDHFEDTVLVTLFSNSYYDTKEILSYLQNLAMKTQFKIQILSKENLPKFCGLERKLSFNLMKKILS